MQVIGLIFLIALDSLFIISVFHPYCKFSNLLLNAYSGFRCTWASNLGDSCCQSSLQWFLLFPCIDWWRYNQLENLPTPNAIAIGS